jgi:hypothetical protein
VADEHCFFQIVPARDLGRALNISSRAISPVHLGLSSRQTPDPRQNDLIIRSTSKVLGLDDSVR